MYNECYNTGAVELDGLSASTNFIQMRYLAINAISKDTPTYRIITFTCPVQTCMCYTEVLDKSK